MKSEDIRECLNYLWHQATHPITGNENARYLIQVIHTLHDNNLELQRQIDVIKEEIMNE